MSTVKCLTRIAVLILAFSIVRLAWAALSGPDQRTAITYWANPAEYAAYQRLCTMAKEQNLAAREETDTYSPTNYFQIQLGPLFTNWITTLTAMDRDKNVRDLATAMQGLSEQELSVVKSVIDGMRPITNAPPIPNAAKLLSKPSGPEEPTQKRQGEK